MNGANINKNIKEIAVIIPVWNGMRDLPACLSALERQTRVSFNVFAVDNASSDGSADYINQYWPGVHLIRSRENVGFARACNLGIQEAHGHSIFVLLNQDTEVFPDWLAQLVAPLREYPSIGIAGSKAIYPNGRIQHAGGRIDTHGVGYHIGRGERDHGQFGVMREADFVTGAALAITRPAYEAVGGLDEEFSPAYFEDVDWCYRVRNAGYKVVFVPDSMLVHKEGPSLSAGGHEAEFMLHRNRLRFVLKHWPIDKLEREFMPAEERWLTGLGYQGQKIVGVMHRAYLYQLVRLEDIVHARSETFTDGTEELDGLASVLLKLRAIYPLSPAQLKNTEPQFMPKPKSTWMTALVGRFQRRFPRISRSLITAPVMKSLVHLTNQQQVAEVLVEYIRENNREIGELAREFQSLRSQVHQAHPPKGPT